MLSDQDASTVQSYDCTAPPEALALLRTCRPKSSAHTESWRRSAVGARGRYPRWTAERESRWPSSSSPPGQPSTRGRRADWRVNSRRSPSLFTPNVVKVFDTGVHHGYPYLAMELVDGLTLRNYLDLDAPTPRRPRANRTTHRFPGRTATLGNGAAHAPSPSLSWERSRPVTTPPSEPARTACAPWPTPSTSRTPTSPRDVSLPQLEPTGALPTLSAVPPVDTAFLNRPERTARLRDAMLQLCDALSYVHGHGLIHRDLKPSNVMVDGGESRSPHGLRAGQVSSRPEDGAVTAGGQLVGTFRYIGTGTDFGRVRRPPGGPLQLGRHPLRASRRAPPFNAEPLPSSGRRCWKPRPLS